MCTNPECCNFAVEKEVLTHTHVIRDGRSFCPETVCRKCGAEGKDLTPFVPISKKNFVIGEIASMSKEKKVEVLKKRSHDHFKKNIAEKKDSLIKRAVGEMKAKVQGS